MRHFGERGLLVSLLAVMLAACNLQINQGGGGNSSVEQAAATIVAMTMQARAGIPNGTLITPFASPAVATPTVKPTVSIHTDGAKCKSGPGADFKVIATYSVGTVADLLGKDTADGYWLVKDPSSGSSCWVQIQDATPAGSFELLPEVTPQPVAQTAPGRPGHASFNFNCDSTSLTTILAWNAPTGTVNGYRLYREGTKIADLDAGTTTYNETIPFNFGSSMNYAVEAYNDGRVSAIDLEFHLSSLDLQDKAAKRHNRSRNVELRDLSSCYSSSSSLAFLACLPRSSVSRIRLRMR